MALSTKHAVVVATGGPCGGKTTLLGTMSAWCFEHNFFPVTVPESATCLITSGANPRHPEFQSWVIEEHLMLLRLRERVADNAPMGRTPVLLLDRGLMDGAPYCDSLTHFEVYLARHGLSLTDALSYPKGVLCLQTAAIGAQEHYTLENNPARRETVSQAKQLDRRTREAWHGTPHLSYIKNRTGGTFAGKMTESLKALARILGVPEPLEYERKFLVGGFSPRRLPAAARGVDIIQTYLMSPPGTFERVRARGIGGQWHYFHTIKEPRSDGQAAEYERVVDIHEYNTLLRRVDPLREPIEKIRYCFTRGHHYVEVDVFKNRPGLVLAEIELEDAQTPYDAPQFLGTVTEVTGMKAYSNYQIALREISQ